MTVAGERDKMAPQLQELAWQNRGLERQVADLTKDAEKASQVEVTLLSPFTSCLKRVLSLRKGIHHQHLLQQQFQ